MIKNKAEIIHIIWGGGRSSCAPKNICWKFYLYLKDFNSSGEKILIISKVINPVVCFYGRDPIRELTIDMLVISLRCLNSIIFGQNVDKHR